MHGHILIIVDLQWGIVWQREGLGLDVQAVVNNLELLLQLLAVPLFKRNAQDVDMFVISNFHDCKVP